MARRVPSTRTSSTTWSRAELLEAKSSVVAVDPERVRRPVVLRGERGCDGTVGERPAKVARLRPADQEPPQKASPHPVASTGSLLAAGIRAISPAR